MDAFTSKELVSFNTKVLDEHVPFAWDVLADLVLNPLFREDDIEKEKGVILEEIKMEADQPEFVKYAAVYVVFAAIDTGVGKLTCCHPVALSAVKVACESKLPVLE